MSESKIEFSPKAPDTFEVSGGTIEGMFDVDADCQDDEVVMQVDYDKLMEAYWEQLYAKYNKLNTEK
jgi:hypothetical protein